MLYIDGARAANDAAMGTGLEDWFGFSHRGYLDANKVARRICIVVYSSRDGSWMRVLTPGTSGALSARVVCDVRVFMVGAFVCKERVREPSDGCLGEESQRNEQSSETSVFESTGDRVPNERVGDPLASGTLTPFLTRTNFARAERTLPPPICFGRGW